MFLLRMPLLCLLLLCGGPGMPPCLAQPPADQVELRHFDQQALEEYRNDPAYRYDRDLQRAPNAWERFKEWLRKLLQRFLGSGVGGFLGNNLMYLLMLLALGLAIWLLSKGPLRSVFHGAPRSLGEVTAVEEDIRELDLPALIAEAERVGDLRRAIRLHYLLVLRLLVDRGVLQWAPQHTDRDYLAQIEDATLRQRFAKAARTFQWTWYGHAAVTPARYEVLRTPFLQFEQPQRA
jgi:hypothetical protein